MSKGNKKDTKQEVTEDQPKTRTNKLTQMAGLTFNVNPVRTKLISYYESQGKENPKYSKGHVAMAAMMECLYRFVLTECEKRTKENQSGGKQVTRELVHYTVRLNTMLNDYFELRLRKFDKNQMYSDQLPMTDQEMRTVCDGVNSKMTLTGPAHNLVCYLTLCTFTDIANTCLRLLNFAGKKSLDPNCVLTAIADRFSDGLAHDLSNEVTRACNAVIDDDEEDTKEVKSAVDEENNIKDNTVDVHDPEENVAEEPEEPKPKVKKQTTTTTTAKPTPVKQDKTMNAKQSTQSTQSAKKPVNNNTKPKQVATIDQEDVSDGNGDDDDNDDNENADQEDDEQEAEPEPEPVKPAKNTTTKKAVTTSANKKK